MLYFHNSSKEIQKLALCVAKNFQLLDPAAVTALAGAVLTPRNIQYLLSPCPNPRCLDKS